MQYLLLTENITTEDVNQTQGENKNKIKTPFLKSIQNTKKVHGNNPVLNVEPHNFHHSFELVNPRLRIVLAKSSLNRNKYIAQYCFVSRLSFSIQFCFSIIGSCCLCFYCFVIFIIYIVIIFTIWCVCYCSFKLQDVYIECFIDLVLAIVFVDHEITV